MTPPEPKPKPKPEPKPAAPVATWTFTGEVLKGAKSACRFLELPASCDLSPLGYSSSASVPVSVVFSHNGVKSAPVPGPLYYHGPGKPRILLLRTAVREALGCDAGAEVTAVVKVSARAKRAVAKAAKRQAGLGKKRSKAAGQPEPQAQQEAKLRKAKAAAEPGAEEAKQPPAKKRKAATAPGA